MTYAPPRPRILILGGPTAAGKTATSLEIARRWDAVVLSADAMQVYRGMDVGTAKATPAERGAILHYGLDLVNPDEDFDAAAFVALGDAVLRAHPRVIACGGTGMWLNALVRGLVETPPVDRALRASLEAEAEPWARLSEVDPALAARLHPNDRVRLIRGLEVWHQTGTRLSDLQAAHATAPDRLEAHGLWLDHPDLDARIDARVLSMMDAGYVEEVAALLAAGYPRDLKPMGSLGYRHLTAHLLDGLPRDEAIRCTQRDTRTFARKQRNWLRQLGWPRVEVDPISSAERAAERAFGG